MKPADHIRARMQFLRTDEGGRRGPAFSGYRPAFYFGQPDGGYDGAIFIEGKATACPGDECNVRVRFTHPEWVKEWVRPGTAFNVKEGTKVVARGQVTEILQLRPP